MYCTACGTRCPEGMNVCPNCGTAAPAFAQPAFGVQPAIQNYLVPAILITLCCCLPAGIVAIIYAAQVNSKLAAGDIAGAQASARLAKIWSWAGFGGGIFLGILYVIFGFLGALNGRHY